MTRGNVHKARAGGIIDEAVPGKKLTGAFAEGVLILELTQMATVETAYDLITLPAAFLSYRRQQQSGDNQLFFADLNQRIAESGIVSHRQVRGQGPGRSGPNDDGSSRVAEQGKLNVYALAHMVLVFHLSLGKGCAAGNTPVDRLLSTVHESLFHDICKKAQFVRLILLVKGQVRVLPIAEDSQPLELRALDVDIFPGVIRAQLANGCRISIGISRLPHVLGYLELNRQAMTVPTRHIRSPEPADRLVLHDHVFQNLIQGIADVNVSVREGRSVMQYKRLSRSAPGLDSMIELLLFPLLQPLRFPYHQVGFHGKLRLRQIQCVLIIHGTSQRRENLSVASGSVNECSRGKTLPAGEQPGSRRPE